MMKTNDWTSASRFLIHFESWSPVVIGPMFGFYSPLWSYNPCMWSYVPQLATAIIGIFQLVSLDQFCGKRVRPRLMDVDGHYEITTEKGKHPQCKINFRYDLRTHKADGLTGIQRRLKPVPFPCRSRCTTSKTGYYVPSAAFYVFEFTFRAGFDSRLPPQSFKRSRAPSTPERPALERTAAIS